jgi:hypothetical protein
MFSFLTGRSSTIVLGLSDTEILAAVVRAKRSTVESITAKAHVPLSAGAMKNGRIVDAKALLQASNDALKALNVSVRSTPMVVALPSAVVMTACMDGTIKGSLSDALNTLMPLPLTTLVHAERSVNGVSGQATSVVAMERTVLEAYRSLAQNLHVRSPIFVSRSQAVVSALPPAAQPHVLIDETAHPAVMSLVLRDVILDERVLFGNDGKEAMNESLQSWAKPLTPASGAAAFTVSLIGTDDDAKALSSIIKLRGLAPAITRVASDDPEFFFARCATEFRFKGPAAASFH